MNKTLKLVKNNGFLSIIIVTYGILLISRPDLGLAGVQNSGYYIKEMLMIMPVIFVLTALLDTWVPKETIIKVLGRQAKTKGVVLSFLLGSISAGPIYAAFPFCVMLHNKGASIKNIVIILSSWAVIKLPMLLNEAKFLGFRFMLFRWVITVFAILIFASITDKLIKDSDLPQDTDAEEYGLVINEDACMGCTICTKKYPQVFKMEGKKAVLGVYSDLDLDQELLSSTIRSCPVMAIRNVK